MHTRQRCPRAGPPGAPVPPQYSIDWDALLDSIDGDAGFARDLTGAFIDVADRELARIAAALNAGDARIRAYAQGRERESACLGDYISGGAA